MASFQHEEHCHYSDRFPFSYAWSTDHLTGKTDAILKRPQTDPLLIHTDSSTEYWQRHASLVHTDTKGKDLTQPESVRIYLWASSQHWAIPPLNEPARRITQQHHNVVFTSPLFRALLDHLDRWATNGTPPPPSNIPSRKQGTLLSFQEWRTQFPSIPGMALPRGPNRFPLYDYGPDADNGYFTVEPPKEPAGGEEYPVLVPAVDQDGNEVAGIRMPVVQAPLGTYMGWNIRARGFCPGDMAGFVGSYIPFPATRAEREAMGDPRLSKEERYPAKKDYMGALIEAAERLVAEGFLLQEDIDPIAQAASFSL